MFAISALTASAALVAQDSSAAVQAPPTPFTVSYSVEWKGISAGVMTMRLTQTSPNNYVYDSTTVARGLARLLVADAVKQTSTFRLDNAAIVPVSFRGIDEKERTTQIDFDWTRKRVSGTARGAPVDVALEPGAQDPLSLQLATQRELAAGRITSTVWMFDGDKLKEFEQRREGAATLKTALGTLDTVIVTTHRVGSNRVTRTWYAPTLGYLPVQAQRLRDGKAEVTIRVRSFKR